MQFKPFATLLIAASLLTSTMLSAQTATPAAADTKTTTAKPADKKSNDPASQSWRKNKKAAKKLIKAGKIDEATPYLEAGAKQNPKKIYFADNLTRVEIKLRNYQASNTWHKVMVDKDSVKHKKPEYLFGYALTQKYLGQYEDAKANFAKFKKLAGESDEASDLKKRATREIEGCDRGIFYRDSVSKRDFKVKRLDSNINQSSSNFAPATKGNALYFNSQKGNNALIFKSTKSGKTFGAADDLPSTVNVANANVTAPAFSADGNTLYYTVCPNDNGQKEKPKCEVYKSTYNGGTWDKGVSVGSGVNDGLSNNMQPAVGKNKDAEDVLYFVSDRNVGKGLDLFYAKINTDGTIGKARSVGSMINSKGDETTPFYDVQSKTLYFSSNGLINIGGLDVFKTTWDANGDWVEPENLGTPINSSVDDYYFSINDKNTLGYEASNRVDPSVLKSGCATCTDDIYLVETTKLFLAVTGTVYEEKDNQRVPVSQGSVMLYDERNGTELGSYIPVNGGYFFDLQPKRGYKVLTRRDGYYDGVSSFNTDNNTESDTLKYDLFLKKREEANPLIGRVIGRIYYDYDQARLRADSRDSLRKILDIMTQFPNLQVEVGAHTDGKGTEDYNLALSKKRADAVMNYYIYEKKVNKNRLTPKAYGTSQPVAPNKTPAGKDDPKGRALNRRTEFKFIDEIKGDQLAAPVKEEKKTPAPAVVPAKESKKTTSKKTAEAAPKKEEPRVAKVVKRDIVPSKKETAPVMAPKPVAKETAPAATPKSTTPEGAYKTAPSETVTLSGKVYVEKGGKRQAATEASVFLSSDANGFEQKVFYVKGDGSYSFDLTRAAPGTYKVIARKDQFESNEISLSLDHIKAVKAPINLDIQVK